MTPATAALTLRRAVLQDGPFLLALRNADDVRSQSKNQELISEEIHGKWLEQHLRSAGTVIWIIEREGGKLGYIRAQQPEEPGETGTWLLSMAMGARARGKGYGTWAVMEVCRLLQEDFSAHAIVADVLSKNAAALRLFKRTGFIRAARVRERSQNLWRLELPLRKIESGMRQTKEAST